MAPSRRDQQLTPSGVNALLLEQFKDPGTIKCTDSGDTRLPDSSNVVCNPGRRRAGRLVITKLRNHLDNRSGVSRDCWSTPGAGRRTFKDYPWYRACSLDSDSHSRSLNVVEDTLPQHPDRYLQCGVEG